MGPVNILVVRTVNMGLQRCCFGGLSAWELLLSHLEKHDDRYWLCDGVIPQRYRVLLGSVTITDYFWHIITWLRWQAIALSHTWPRCHTHVHSQLFVSLATATIPIGCCGISALNTFISPPTYLSALRTALRTQSVQKMWSPYTARPKGCTGSFFRTTYIHRAQMWTFWTQ